MIACETAFDSKGASVDKHFVDARYTFVPTNIV
jgi:hypothetical protein